MVFVLLTSTEGKLLPEFSKILIYAEKLHQRRLFEILLWENKILFVSQVMWHNVSGWGQLNSCGWRCPHCIYVEGFYFRLALVQSVYECVFSLCTGSQTAFAWAVRFLSKEIQPMHPKLLSDMNQSMMEGSLEKPFQKHPELNQNSNKDESMIDAFMFCTTRHLYGESMPTLVCVCLALLSWTVFFFFPFWYSYILKWNEILYNTFEHIFITYELLYHYVLWIYGWGSWSALRINHTEVYK